MYISKKFAVSVLTVMIFSGVLLYVASGPRSVHAQSSVVPFTGARYLFTGSESNPAIFDTSTGIYRVWSPSDKHQVTTYDFNTHKVVEVDSLSFR